MNSGGDDPESPVVFSPFVVASSETAAVLEPVDQALDSIALAIEFLVERT